MIDFEQCTRASWRGRHTPAALTREEREALEICALGHDVVTCAEMLGRPPGMVRSGLRSAIDKLGARSKLEAVVIGLRAGLIARR